MDSIFAINPASPPPPAGGRVRGASKSLWLYIPEYSILKYTHYVDQIGAVSSQQADHNQKLPPLWCV